MEKLFNFIRISRPANVVTAIADILAGAGIAASLTGSLQSVLITDLAVLMIISSCLYVFGIVLNDIFDIEEDRIHRPERLIVSGRISLREATTYAVIAMVLALSLSLLIGILPVVITFGIIVMIVIYNYKAKHYPFFGPFTMASCRMGNLLLGMSVLPDAVSVYWPVSVVPLLFIFGVTLTSAGETEGKNRRSLMAAMAIDLLASITIAGLTWHYGGNVWQALPFVLLWWGINVRYKLIAITDNVPENVKAAVKMGVLSIIPLNACHAAGYSEWYYALFILLLFPLSIFLAKKTSVT